MAGFLASQTSLSLAPARDVTDGYNPLRYPRTEAEWFERLDWLHSAYVGQPYTLEDHSHLRLFLAYDDAENVIAETYRVTRDVQHVVDTDSRAMAPRMMVLERADGGSSALLAQCEYIWKRSSVKRQAGAWARWCASMGSVMFEAVNMSPTAPRLGTVIARDPRAVELVYDEATNTRLVKAIVRFRFYDAGDVDPFTGNAQQDAALHTYVRVLDPQEVNVWLDGEWVEAESGEHRLGVVPMVHVPFTPYTDPAHGLWAAHGLESAVAGIDAIYAQVRAVGNRYGNPRLVVKGAKLGADSDVQQFGRAISGVPADGSVEYLEASLQGIAGLLDAVQSQRDMARATLPEFLFAGAGANTSAEALSLLSAAFRLKMEDVRERWFSGLLEATGMAAAIEERRAYDGDEVPLRIDASPVMPPDVAAELGNVETAKRLGMLTPAQVVEHGQRLGLVDASVDPQEQATEVEDRTAERAAAFFTQRPGAGAPPDDG